MGKKRAGGAGVPPETAAATTEELMAILAAELATDRGSGFFFPDQGELDTPPLNPTPDDPAFPPDSPASPVPAPSAVPAPSERLGVGKEERNLLNQLWDLNLGDSES